MARKNIMWSEEDFEKVFHGLLDLKDSEPSFRVTGAWILRAMHATLPNSKHRNKIGVDVAMEALKDAWMARKASAGLFRVSARMVRPRVRSSRPRGMHRLRRTAWGAAARPTAWMAG